jgi:hypothetical protein
MTRSFHRTLIVPSLVAGIGSFLIEVSRLLFSVVPLPEAVLEKLPVPSRDFGIVACVAVIAFAIGGLAVIHLLRGGGKQK